MEYLTDFRKNHPNKFFNMGICEQSLIGVAAGMSLGGTKTMGLYNHAFSH